eukprot:8286284-Pyramimonas_sp.AAC.1
MWDQIERDQPEIIWMCSECRVFSAINRVNRDRRDPERWHQEVMEALRDLILCMEVAQYQYEKGRYFAFEHPLYASSWTTQVVQLITSLPGVQRLRVDMCCFDMQ